MATPDRTDQGVLFKNDNKREDSNDPDYTGSINVGGVDRWLSAWIKESGPNSKTPGRKFLSIAVGKPKDEQPSRNRQIRHNGEPF